MNGVASVLLFLASAALLALPRRWVLLPLMIGACWVPFYTGVDIGGFNFNAVRMLIAVGILRVAIRGETPTGSPNGIDYAIIAWAIWLLASSFFHEDPFAALKLRLGLAYDALGIYALMRVLCRSIDDILNICRIVVIVLAPLAAEMLYEKATGNNLFAFLGGAEESLIREGHVRANGPFGHPILAGTVGAVSLPLMAGLWKMRRRLLASFGIASCLAIIFSSSSSGPIVTALAGFFALWMWRYRHRVRAIQLMAVAAYIALDIVTKDPAYFLIARVDLVGGSTSWYRARLIQSAFEHLDEWWLAGTDITRHWMWVRESFFANQTDITSYYIQMGVWGGLPLMVLFIFVLIRAFGGVTQVLRREANLQPGSGFLGWTFGSSLFAFAATSFSISYFDQSFVFLYVVLGTIGSAWSIVVRAKVERRRSAWHPAPRAQGQGMRASLHPSSEISAIVK